MKAIEVVNKDAAITLKITTNGIKAEFESQSGNKIYKNIGLQSMARVLNSDTEFDTGFLPLYGKNYMGIKRYLKYPDKEILFIEASPSCRTVKFGKSSIVEYPNVMFPGLLMPVVCRTEKNGQLKVMQSRLYATRGPILRETDILYNFPFGNVYSDGRICWGNVNPAANIRTLMQAGSMLEQFLFNVMNNDLYQGGTPLESYIKDLQSAADFPYEKLKANGLNFKDLMSLMKSKNTGV